MTAEAAEAARSDRRSLYAASSRCGSAIRSAMSARRCRKYVEANGFSVVREFVGHGIGTQLHEEPQVPNYRRARHGARLREGMVLAIEPMVNAGKPETRVLDDKWTAVTEDGSLQRPLRTLRGGHARRWPGEF